jgi:hypothetical protein
MLVASLVIDYILVSSRGPVLESFSNLFLSFFRNVNQRDQTCSAVFRALRVARGAARVFLSRLVLVPTVGMSKQVQKIAAEVFSSSIPCIEVWIVSIHQLSVSSFFVVTSPSRSFLRCNHE